MTTTTTDENHAAGLTTTSTNYLIDVMNSADGRWTEILVSAGFPPEILDGENHDCPVCGTEDSFHSLPRLDEHGMVECRECHNTKTEIKPNSMFGAIQWIKGRDICDAMDLVTGFLGIQDELIRKHWEQRQRNMQNA